MKFLVPTNATAECMIAVFFAAKMAKITKNKILILHVLENETFGHWHAVNSSLEDEAMKEGRKILRQMSKICEDITGEKPESILKTGDLATESKKIIDDDKDINLVFLGASKSNSGPGKLVSSISSKPLFLAKRQIPIIIVPEDVDQDELNIVFK